MLSRTLGALLRAIVRLPFVYPVLAFVLARRIAVRGWSMYPTLAPGEYVLFDALAYRLASPRRGDVVLASHPTRPEQRIIKRVAAVAGDRVAIADGACCLQCLYPLRAHSAVRL